MSGHSDGAHENAPLSCPTTPADVPRKAATRESWFRRIGTVVLAAVVVLTLLGALGPRTHIERLAAGTNWATVEHPTVLRRGLDSEITVTVPATGSREPLRLALTADAVTDLGLDTIVPEPESTTADGDRLVWEFAGTGKGFTVTFFGRTATKAPPGRKHWTLTWFSPDGEKAVHATTWVLP